MTTRSSERGIAMIATLFMVLLLSVLGSGMMFISQTEAISSLNYKTMSQARYAAESGVHAAANHLLYSYAPPNSNVADPLAFYDTTASPVLYDGNPVVLSSSATVDSNYPVEDVITAFQAATQGTLAAGAGTVLNTQTASYSASARLLSMRTITDSMTGLPTTLQTWEITGRGTVNGIGAAQVEVTAIVEQQHRPIYPYAAFAQDNGCGALTFSGNFATDSYDSRLYGGSGTPTIDQHSGNVGTNGNLNIGGSAEVNGSLSTPRTGVGSCSDGSVTALTGSTLDVTAGMVQLPQSITWPTPPDPSPMPPTTDDSFTKMGGCPPSLSAPVCVASVDGATITPDGSTPVVLGNVSMGNQAVVHLKAGTYIVNSLAMGAQAELVIDSGPVYFKVAGVDESKPFDTGGGSFTNTSYDPSQFQIIYGGSATLEMRGGSAAAAVVYAPNAFVDFAGTSDMFGAMIADRFDVTGTGRLHYDRALDTKGITVGNPAMTSFSWRSF